MFFNELVCFTIGLKGKYDFFKHGGVKSLKIVTDNLNM